MKDYKQSLEIMKQELNNKYISPEIKYAFEASIESLEKQIEKDAIPNGGTDPYFHCPVCGEFELEAKCENYCPECGQKLKYK